MIFIDTGAFVARYRASDSCHAAASEGWRRLATGGRRCFTSDLVVAEVITLLARYVGAKPAADRARIILTSESLTILRPARDDELRAADLLEKYADQRIGFVDCISFVLMKNNRLRTAFSFDRHFEAAGFTLWPKRTA